MLLRSFSRTDIRLIFLDIETTGFNVFKNNIIEIAAIDSNNNKFETLTNNNGRNIPKKISELTNINNEMLLNQPTIEEVLVKFIDYLKMENNNNNTYLIGHNINSFDLPFIKAQCQKYNLKFPDFKTIDTMRMSQYILKDQYYHNLGALSNLFGINNENAHRAMSDVYTTKIIFNNLCLLFKRDYGKCTPNILYYRTTLFR